MKKKIIFIFAMFFMVLGVVSAESKYYRDIWSYDWKTDGEYSEITDMLEYDEGYFAVGYYGDADEDYTGVILRFDSEGKYLSKVEKEDIEFTKVIQSGDSYYAFGLDGNNGYTWVYELSNEGKVVDSISFRDWCEYEDIASFHVVEDSDNFYIFSNNYYPDYWPMKVYKDLSDYEWYDEYEDDLTTAQRKLLAPYMNLYYFYGNEIYNSSLRDWDSFGVTDSEKYEDGFLVTGIDYNNEVSYLYYEEDGDLVWKKTFDGEYIENVIVYDGHIIITSADYEDEETEKDRFEVLDSKGNVLEDTDVLTNYCDYKEVYADYMMDLANGFSLSYVPYDEENITRITYYTKYYNIKTETGVGGVSNVQLIASKDEKVKIVVTPQDGYVLGEIKVIDSNGNVIKVDDNMEFVMPDSDVTVSVSFVKNTIKSIVENPKTSVIGITGVVILFIISLVSIVINYKKKKALV